MTPQPTTTRRRSLPQLGDGLFLTDGGLETTLVFQDGMELPAFASFPLLESDTGKDRLTRYYEDYLASATRHGTGFVLETPTWRANADWGASLGYSAAELESTNATAVAHLVELRHRHPTAATVISGQLGPRDDGYNPTQKMDAAEAERYHDAQIATFAATEADLVTAFTMTYVEEAVGIVRAAQHRGIPAVISFTVETDGRLPSGAVLDDAVEAVDAATGSGAAYFMINCAHPTHFADALVVGAPWTGRIRGVRANASTRSHAELDEATELDDGDPGDLGRRHAELRKAFPHLSVLGGCCGTDHRHVEAIAAACVA